VGVAGGGCDAGWLEVLSHDSSWAALQSGA
jgi:hypothetical protein